MDISILTNFILVPSQPDRAAQLLNAQAMNLDVLDVCLLPFFLVLD